MCCGRVDTRDNRRASSNERRVQVDPTRAAFAAQRPQYVVVPNSAARTGKRFTTLGAAQEYARNTNGIVRPL
jgi:hypothetical protein